LGREVLQRYAYKALEGAGDPDRGQWEEWTGYAFHVRRRLTSEEETQVGPVLDIRGTAEAWRRTAAVRKYLPVNWQPE
jgi:hypothetical protein